MAMFGMRSEGAPLNGCDHVRCRRFKLSSSAVALNATRRLDVVRVHGGGVDLDGAWLRPCLSVVARPTTGRGSPSRLQPAWAVGQSGRRYAGPTRPDGPT